MLLSSLMSQAAEALSRRPQMLHAWSRHSIMFRRIPELRRSSLESISSLERGRVDWMILAVLSVALGQQLKSQVI